MKIKTDLSAPEEPKDPDNSLIFDLYKAFATPDQIEELANQYRTGIGWGHAKQALFEVIRNHLKEPMEIYSDYMNNKEKLDKVLAQGAEQAREIARPVLDRLRKTIGVAHN